LSEVGKKGGYDQVASKIEPPLGDILKEAAEEIVIR